MLRLAQLLSVAATAAAAALAPMVSGDDRRRQQHDRRQQQGLKDGAAGVVLPPPPPLQQPVQLAAQTALLTFQFRCRATPVAPRWGRGGHPTDGLNLTSGSDQRASGKNVSFRFFSPMSQVSAPVGVWSGIGSFTAKDSAHALEPFQPYPIKLLHLAVSGLSAALTEVDVEIEGSTGVKVVLYARLFGPSMAIMATEVGKPDGPIYWTVRQYNHWKYLFHAISCLRHTLRALYLCCTRHPN